MDKFIKLVLGPYEIFASVIGGLPFTISIYLLANTDTNWHKISNDIISHLEIKYVLLFVFITYVLGDMIQGLSWVYFKRICEGAYLVKISRVFNYKNLNKDINKKFKEKLSKNYKNKRISLKTREKLKKHFNYNANRIIAQFNIQSMRNLSKHN